MIWTVAVGTVVLMGVGALVTTFEAGMSVPDWPNSFGHWMFGLPLDRWIPAMGGAFDVFLEHSHRVIGSIIGMLTIGFVLACWFGDGRWSMIVLSLVALVLVSVQGYIGGQRVVLDERTLAMIHGTLAPAFFAFVVVLINLTSRRIDPSEGEPTSASGWAVSLVSIVSILMVLATYVQIGFGAYLRHFQQGHMVHLLLPILLLMLSLVTLTLAWTVLRDRRPLRRAATWVFLLLLAQASIGVAAWTAIFGLWGVMPQRLGSLEAVTTLLHVIFGAFLLAATVTQAVRAQWLPAVSPIRLSRPQGVEAGA
jgi:cytochrome c oxidase assembly protein subunit 15